MHQNRFYWAGRISNYRTGGLTALMFSTVYSMNETSNCVLNKENIVTRRLVSYIVVLAVVCSVQPLFAKQLKSQWSLVSNLPIEQELYVPEGSACPDAAIVDAMDAKSDWINYYGGTDCFPADGGHYGSATVMKKGNIYKIEGEMQDGPGSFSSNSISIVIKNRTSFTLINANGEFNGFTMGSKKSVNYHLCPEVEIRSQ